MLARLTRLIRRRPAEADTSCRTLQDALDSRTAAMPSDYVPSGGLLGAGLLRSVEPPAMRLDAVEAFDDETGRVEVVPR